MGHDDALEANDASRDCESLSLPATDGEVEVEQAEQETDDGGVVTSFHCPYCVRPGYKKKFNLMSHILEHHNAEPGKLINEHYNDDVCKNPQHCQKPLIHVQLYGG